MEVGEITSASLWVRAKACALKEALMMMKKKYVSPKEAAVYLSVSPSALEKGRLGYGNVRPPFVKIGRFVRYDLSDLDQWGADNTWRSGHGR